MAKITNPFKDVKIVYRRTSPWLIGVLVAAIVLSTATVVTLGWTSYVLETETENMRTEAAQLEAENADLDRRIEQLGSVQSVMEIASEQLGLVDPNTIIIEPGT